MSKSLSVTEIVAILQTGEFHEIVGAVEDSEIEFKGSPYQLKDDVGKHELAKDVSALANARGGVIIIGFKTCKDPNSATELVDECRPFDPSLIDSTQYRMVLEEWVCPHIRPLDISLFRSAAQPGKTVCAIVVGPEARELQPFLVRRVVDPFGRVRGTHIGYYERVDDRIPPISPEALRELIRDGMRFSEILKRLDSVEAFLGDSGPSVPSGLSQVEVLKRISDAEKTVERDGKPNIALAAFSVNASSFPDIFRSNSTDLVRLIEEPQYCDLRDSQLRRQVGVGHRRLFKLDCGALLQEAIKSSSFGRMAR